LPQKARDPEGGRPHQLLLPALSAGAGVMPTFDMNSFLGKQVLSLVRDGDFAHAGEREAIELAMGSVPKDAGQHVLDAGCGRGGTAAD
jgi:hypothetical protein